MDSQPESSGPDRSRGLRFDLSEASGALGDLGTFVPIVVSLVAVCGLDAGTVLLFAGLANVATGLIFRQPIPVQPMKAIAAVAIAEGLAPGSIAAAGLAMGVVLLILSLSGGIGMVERLVPRPIVRGIQLGVGLKLVTKGLDLVAQTSWDSADGWVVAAVLGALTLVASRWRRFPSALVIFAVGLCLMGITNSGILGDLSWGWDGPSLVLPTALEWRTGILQGAVPQLPLTLLNSVIAVCVLSEDLFPGRGVSTRRMATSVSLMNLLSCPFGAMPACHGSGGLAGQYRFGARTGGSVVLLGLAKVVLALALGGSAAVLLASYPSSVLGVLLLFAGAELALPARKVVERDDFLLVVLTAGGVLAVNTAVGFALGLAAALLLPRVRRGEER